MDNCPKCDSGKLQNVSTVFFVLGTLLLLLVVTAPFGFVLLVIGFFTRKDLVCTNRRCRYKCKKDLTL